MKIIADSGFLIALLDRLDAHHRWAAPLIDTQPAPFLVCEAVCAEVAAVLGTPEPMIRKKRRHPQKPVPLSPDWLPCNPTHFNQHLRNP